jgi:hypothetical protein
MVGHLAPNVGEVEIATVQLVKVLQHRLMLFVGVLLAEAPLPPAPVRLVAGWPCRDRRSFGGQNRSRPLTDPSSRRVGRIGSAPRYVSEARGKQQIEWDQNACPLKRRRPRWGACCFFWASRSHHEYPQRNLITSAMVSTITRAASFWLGPPPRHGRNTGWNLTNYTKV